MYQLQISPNFANRTAAAFLVRPRWSIGRRQERLRPARTIWCTLLRFSRLQRVGTRAMLKHGLLQRIQHGTDACALDLLLARSLMQFRWVSSARPLASCAYPLLLTPVVSRGPCTGLSSILTRSSHAALSNRGPQFEHCFHLRQSRCDSKLMTRTASWPLAR